MYGGYTIMPEITGYVTETYRERGCKIKITDDNVTNVKGKHSEVSKEK